MKYSLIVLAVVVLGAGEYAYVEFAPFPPEQRVEKFQRLPVVRAIVRARDISAIREELEASGSLALYNSRQGRSWDDAEELYADYERGDGAARLIMERVRHIDSWHEHLDEIRQRSESGDLSAMMLRHLLGRTQTGEMDMNRAVDLLEKHGSALSRWYLFMNVLHTVDFESRNGQLLVARAFAEHRRPSGLSDEEYARMVDNQNEWLEDLHTRAEAGETNAEWITNHMAPSEATKIRTVDGELEPLRALELAEESIEFARFRFPDGFEAYRESIERPPEGSNGMPLHTPMSLYLDQLENGVPDTVSREYLYAVTDAVLSMTFHRFMNEEMKAEVRVERDHIVHRTADMARSGDKGAIWVREQIRRGRGGYDILEHY